MQNIISFLSVLSKPSMISQIEFSNKYQISAQKFNHQAMFC